MRSFGDSIYTTKANRVETEKGQIRNLEQEQKKVRIKKKYLLFEYALYEGRQ